MSKELEALQVIIENKGLNGIKEPVEIIENAIKETMGLRKVNEFLREDYQKLEEKVNDLERIIKEPDTIILQLKALEIIKEKNVKIDVLKYQSDVIFYNMAVFEKEEELTKEEFYLLKRVLK